MKPRSRAVCLLALGFLNLVGVAFGAPKLSGLAMATAASPAPRVFTTHAGLETFSNRFVLRWTDRVGERHERVITPTDYRGIRGPYNRRNVFGAVLAYGPVLSSGETTRPMYESVARYALCGDAPLLRELGLDPTDVRNVEVEVQPRPGGSPALPLKLEAPCRR